MRVGSLVSLCVVLLSLSSRVQPDSVQPFNQDFPLLKPTVDLSLLSKPFDSLSIVDHAINDSIHLEGSVEQITRLRVWLNEIARVPKGVDTLKAIHRSGHNLVIKHSDAARLSAGRTIAPMTERLTNGVGDDVTIIFDADMKNSGTHIVYDRNNQPLEFTAVQNLYHELAHAMHQMQGQWRYFASEKQAIEEENVFRTEWARLHGEEPRLRFRSRGKRIESFAAYRPIR